MREYKLLLRVLSIRISIELSCIGGRMKPGSPPICLFSNCVQHIHMQRAPTYAIFVDQILQRALRHDSRFYVSWLEGCQNKCLGQTKPNFLFHNCSRGLHCTAQFGTKVSKWHTASIFRANIRADYPKTSFNCKKTETFWVITQQVMAISYRSFGTKYHTYRVFQDFGA